MRLDSIPGFKISGKILPAEALLHGYSNDGLGDPLVNTSVQGIRNQLTGAGGSGDLARSRHQHLLYDPGYVRIDRASKNSRKTQNVIDGFSVGGISGARGQCVSGLDFRSGVGQRQDNLPRPDLNREAVWNLKRVPRRNRPV